MAKRQDPQYSTYKTEQYGLVKDIFSRSNQNYDGLYINCFIESVQQDKNNKQEAVVKRPGTEEKISSGSITSEFRNCFLWESQNVLVTFVGADIVIRNPSTMAVTNTVAHTLGTTTGKIGCTEYIYSSGELALIFSDGNKIAKLSTTFAVTVSSDIDIPTPHNPNIVAMDGYLFIVKSATADIYNSDTDNPLSFTSGEYISAEMATDVVSEIIRMSNYLLAFGPKSIEFFYDAANASGSPLARNDTFFKNIGYLGGLAQVQNRVMFVGKEVSGNIDLFLAEDSKVTALNNQQLKRYLNRATSYSSVRGSLISFNGNMYYLITVDGKTFCVDIMTQNVTQFKYKATEQFPIKYSTTGELASYGMLNFFYNDVDNTLLSFKLDTWTDSGTNYTVVVRTDPHDMGTMQAKFISRLSFFGDRTSAIVNVRWTNDDYQTYSSSTAISMDQELPSLRRLGSFRRRAFEFSTSDQYALRLFGFELDLNMGAS